MAISIVSSVQSMARKLVATIRGSSSSSDQVLSNTKKDLESLEKTLRRIQAVLNDAEEREIGDDSVKLWLKELRWVAYDAENVLGEYQYEIRRAEIMTSTCAAETSRKRKKPQDDLQVYDFTSVLLRLSIPQRIRDIMERFEEISKARKDLQLRDEDGTRSSISHVPQHSSSLVDESGIFGREDDKEAVIQMLLSDKVSCKIPVISIVGMGGLGKTTLAQCVYSDPRISNYFDSKAWVCVSEDFDVRRLTGEMIQSITRQSSCDLTQLDALQAKLKEIVNGKKVLVVLDHVWNEKQSFWDSLKVPFLSAATTRVLVTTRNGSVAEIMQTAGNMYRLGCLPEDKCWTLFCHHAFRCQNLEELYTDRLVEVGRKIMVKCGGLPLAVKTLGSLLLHYGTDEERWREVLESEIWELDRAKDDILPALKLSYYRMPTHLKLCFLFTSIYPKDFRFGKVKVIKMWMAQYYILPRGNKRLEDIGSEYFDELQRRSFFLYDDDLESYVLHDIVHDLARHVSENEHHSIVLESNGKIRPIAAEVRHLFVECQKGVTTLCQVPLEFTKDLRTLIVHNNYKDYLIVDDDQFEHSVHLRVLEVECKRLTYSIGNLKHLCYLDWNGSNDLDDFSSLGHLYNVQTLRLHCTYDFVPYNSEVACKYGSTCSLPSMPDATTNPNQRGICYSSTFSKLVDITLTISRPSWVSLLPLSQLRSLRRLRLASMHNIERVGHENYFYCPLHVRGDDIPYPMPTNNVGFPCLEELIFENAGDWKEWSGVTDGEFPCLRKLTLDRCTFLSKIPMLPSSLKTLHISHCYRLKSLPVNNEQVRFPYMEELVFDHMTAWEEWPSLNSGDFPRLRILTIRDCKRLGRFPLLPSSLDVNLIGQQGVGFPRLEEMVLDNIPESQQDWYRVGDGYFPSLRELTIEHCQKLQGLPTLSSSLKDLCIESCWGLTSLPGLQNLTSLESLKLKRCPNLHISAEEELSSRPPYVNIVNCPLLQEWCNMHQFNCVQDSDGLAELTIYDSNLLIKGLVVENPATLERLELSIEEAHLSPDGWLPPMIQILEVRSCYHLESISLHQSLLLLTRLEIWNCPSLTSFYGLHNLPNLEVLSLEYCPKLHLLPDNPLPSSLQSLSVKNCKKLRSLPLLHEKLSSLEKLEVFNCPDLTIMAGLHNLSSLETFTIRQCPLLRLSSDEQLSSMPHFLSIADCPALEEWCQQQSIPYSQNQEGESEEGERVEIESKEEESQEK